MKKIRRVLAPVLMALALPAQSWALTLGELYALSPTERAWYLGGVYDANVIEWGKDGVRSECLESLGFVGFSTKMAEFVTSLPADPGTRERRAYDSMNVALVAALLVIDKACEEKPSASSPGLNSGKALQ